MVKIVDIESADVPGTYFELSVYRSATGRAVLACGLGAAMKHGVVVDNLIIRFGTPVVEAYGLAREFCDKHGLHIWLRDQHNLFPPKLRTL